MEVLPDGITDGKDSALHDTGIAVEARCGDTIEIDEDFVIVVPGSGAEDNVKFEPSTSIDEISLVKDVVCGKDSCAVGESPLGIGGGGGT